MKTLNKKFLAQDIEVKSAGQYRKKIKSIPYSFIYFIVALFKITNK